MPIESDLLEACRKLAEFAHPNTDSPQNINDIVDSEERERIAQEFHETAIRYANIYKPPTYDQYLILRAVNFMSLFTPELYRANDHWFENTLNVLFRLVDPSVAPIHDAQFLAELRKGIEQMEDWVKEYKT
jgi:hypothetical protein